MSKELSREELRQLARLGAQRRLEELRREEAALRAAFPDLDDEAGASQGRGRKRKQAATKSAGQSQADGASSSAKRSKKRRYKMSAAQKKAVSERMKKYWAAKRKAEA